MDNDTKVILFDVMPYVYTAFYASQAMLKQTEITPQNEKRILNQARSIFINKLRQPFDRLEGPFIPIFCYDGRPKRKTDANKEYKANRKPGMSWESRASLLNTAREFQGYHALNKEEEADDLIATFKDKIIKLNKGYKIYIMSKDNDLLQLCDENTTFVDVADWAKVRGIEYLQEKFKIDNFKHIILHKICFGDSSDNIKGIFKGKRRAAIIDKIKTCKNMKDFMCLDIITDDLKPKIKELWDLIKLRSNLNYDLKFVKESNYTDVKLVEVDL